MHVADSVKAMLLHRQIFFVAKATLMGAAVGILGRKHPQSKNIFFQTNAKMSLYDFVEYIDTVTMSQLKDRL